MSQVNDGNAAGQYALVLSSPGQLTHVLSAWI
jgi:hypothetical protein